MNIPTTLYTTLLAAPLPVLVLPAQAHEEIQWQNIVIAAPEHLADTATALAEQLRPLTEGDVSIAHNNSPLPQDCTRIELSERKGPAFAYVVWPAQEHYCIRLILSSSENKQNILQRFINGLRPAVHNGKFAPVDKDVLRESLMDAVRPQLINWDTIVISGAMIYEETEAAIADWFRRNTCATVHVHCDHIGDFQALDYGASYILLQLDLWEEDAGLSITRGPLVPTLHIKCSFPGEAPLIFDAAASAALTEEALHHLEQLRALMKDGKLPPIRVEELQEALNRKIESGAFSTPSQ